MSYYHIIDLNSCPKENLDKNNIVKINYKNFLYFSSPLNQISKNLINCNKKYTVNFCLLTNTKYTYWNGRLFSLPNLSSQFLYWDLILENNKIWLLVLKFKNKLIPITLDVEIIDYDCLCQISTRRSGVFINKTIYLGYKSEITPLLIGNKNKRFNNKIYLGFLNNLHKSYNLSAKSQIVY